MPLEISDAVRLRGDEVYGSESYRELHDLDRVSRQEVETASYIIRGGIWGDRRWNGSAIDIIVHVIWYLLGSLAEVV